MPERKRFPISHPQPPGRISRRVNRRMSPVRWTDALQQSSADPISAVIILSDGTQRVPAPRVPWQQPARELARRGIPLYTVAVGQERERSQARDVAMLSLPDEYSVFASNELAIRGAVRVQGYVNRPIPITLRVEQMDGREVHSETRNVQVTEDGDIIDAEFRYVPREPGEFFLRVVAAVQDDEQIVDNNELGAFLHVAEGGVRVLYLDGNPGWQEQKFIRRAIDAAVEIDVDYAWVDIRTRGQWPIPTSGSSREAALRCDFFGRCPRKRIRERRGCDGWRNKWRTDWDS